MELLFETRAEIIRVEGQVYFSQCKPRIHPEPVLSGDTPIDACGATFYGSVLRDGGVYRMWYQAWPEDWTEEDHDSALVAYAESDDGIAWRKPVLNQVEYRGSKKNNLVNLGVHSPGVFIDPTAPASHRYRATGAIDGLYRFHHPIPNPPHEGGYFTFHSADGFHWGVDSPEPTWMWADCISSIWHPGRGQGEVLMKRALHMGGMVRRSCWNAALKKGAWSHWKAALIPDDYDDLIARRSGGISADYYGAAMMPAGKAMVAFIVQLRHRHPLKPTKVYGGVVGNWGEADVTLAYQSEEGAQWLRPSGRPDFLTHGEVPWARGGWYLGSNVVDCGEEQRLYATGTVSGHMAPRPGEKTLGSIGFASWPGWRLFEFRAQPKGELDIDLGVLKQPSELQLNYKTYNSGSVRAQLLWAKPLHTLQEIDGRKADDGVPMTGDKIGEVVRWKNGSVIQPVPGMRMILRLYVEHASVFAYEVRPVN